MPCSIATWWRRALHHAARGGRDRRARWRWRAARGWVRAGADYCAAARGRWGPRRARWSACSPRRSARTVSCPLGRAPDRRRPGPALAAGAAGPEPPRAGPARAPRGRGLPALAPARPRRAQGRGVAEHRRLQPPAPLRRSGRRRRPLPAGDRGRPGVLLALRQPRPPLHGHGPVRAGRSSGCSTAIRLNPNHFRARANLGVALQTLRRYDEAVAAYRAALALNPDDAVVHAYLGRSLLSLGRDGEGVRELQTAVRLDPSLTRSGSSSAGASPPTRAASTGLTPRYGGAPMRPDPGGLPRASRRISPSASPSSPSRWPTGSGTPTASSSSPCSGSSAGAARCWRARSPSSRW